MSAAAIASPSFGEDSLGIPQPSMTTAPNHCYQPREFQVHEAYEEDKDPVRSSRGCHLYSISRDDREKTNGGDERRRMAVASIFIHEKVILRMWDLTEDSFVLNGGHFCERSWCTAYLDVHQQLKKIFE